ncbi:MAG: hypothetical protein AB7S38_41010 [Vulcanimicrobiota bacterium]
MLDRLEKLREALELWRQEKTWMAAPIPDEIWDGATELACEAGVGPVSKALRLDHAKLKRLCEERLPAPAFLEVRSGLRPGQNLACVLEVAPGGGLRASISGATAADLGIIFRAFAG